VSLSDDGLSETRTVARALELLDCIADAKEPLSVAELAREIRVSRSTAYRLLRTLSAHGYVSDSFADSDKLQIGPKVLKLATHFLDRLDIRVVARPHLIQLRDLSHETVHLVVPHHTQALHIDRVETSQALRTYSPVGGLEPLHSTSMGKALLAAMSDAEVEAIVLQAGLPRLTPNTITDLARLKEHLALVRAQGYAISDIENEEGIRAVGVALVAYTGVPLAAISISGPAYRFTLEQAIALAPPMKRAAADILYQLGLGPRESEADPAK
jgi:IclR family transcriptional regulator, KDG regulon repressor